jgi:hypothetical protein
VGGRVSTGRLEDEELGIKYFDTEFEGFDSENEKSQSILLWFQESFRFSYRDLGSVAVADDSPFGGKNSRAVLFAGSKIRSEVKAFHLNNELKEHN